MSAESPKEGLRLLAMLIAADLLAGSPALAEAPTDAAAKAPRRGRKPTKVVAVAAHHPIARAA